MVKFNLSQDWKRICKTVPANKQIEFLIELIDLKELHPRKYIALFLVSLIFISLLAGYNYTLFKIFTMTWFILLILHNTIYLIILNKFNKKWCDPVTPLFPVEKK